MTRDQTGENALFIELYRSAPTKGERTKQRIVSAAVDCIAELGVAGTNFESVGKRVGMARRNIAYHFPELDHLLILCIQYVVAQGQRYAVERLRKSTDWRARLRLYIASTYEWLAENSSHGAVLLSLYHLATFDERYRRLYGEIRQAGEGRIRILLEGAPASPQAREAAAQSIYDLLNGGVVRFVSQGSSGQLRLWTRGTFDSACLLVAKT